MVQARGTKRSSGRRRPLNGLSADETNVAYNALDHHVKNGRGGRTALIYANERGERRVYTYAQLLYHVERVAAALRGLGIEKGDRITIYMPTMPEAIMLMLACARIGAIHLCVFAGFGSGALADRIRASESKLIFATRRDLSQGQRCAAQRSARCRARHGCAEHRTCDCA